MELTSKAEVMQAIEQAERQGMEPFVLVVPISPEYLEGVDRVALRRDAEQAVADVIAKALAS